MPPLKSWRHEGPENERHGMARDGQWFDTAGNEMPTEAPVFDVGVAHIACVYDYWLGGKDNFAADREAGN
jgi:hypothetical protein